MNTLIINAHPEYFKETSYTSIMQNTFIERFKEKYDSEIKVLNLYDETNYIPVLDKDMLSVFNQKYFEAELTEKQQKIQRRMKEIVEEFKSYKRIIIVTPTFNFNIVSKLKDYMDNILIPGETFRYQSAGPEGLLTDGRKVLYMATSGSIYDEENIYNMLDFNTRYIKGMFVDFMGFDSFEILRVEGTAKSSVTREMILEKLDKDIEKMFEVYYS